MTIYDPLSEALGIEPIQNPSYLQPFTKEEIELLSLIPIPGPKHCDLTKLQISESNKEHYKTEYGIYRRQRLSDRNKKVKSQEMKDRWIRNYDAMKFVIAKNGGRKKGSKDLKARQKRCNIRKITDGNTVYKDAYEAAAVYGIHPVNIRRKCRKMLENWRYI